jgi:type I restriction enzyme S subunit
MTHWKTAMLGDLVDPADTWNPAKAASDEVFNYIDLSAVDQEAKLIRGAQRVVGSEAPSRARQLVAKGDVLVSTVRPNLNGVAKVPEDLDGATASTGFCILRARSTVLDRSYLFHWVKSPEFVGEMVRKATGASYPAVSDRIIFESRLPIPPVSEQRRIAEVLDRAEALRAKRRSVLAQLDTLIESIFLDLFGDPATNLKGLRIESLGDHLLFVTSGGRGWAEFYAPTGSRFIRSFDVQMNQIGDEDSAFVLPPDNAEARRTRVMAGDVLLTITGSRIGRVAPVPENLNGAYISQHVAILRADPKRIEPTFLSFFLSFDAGGQRQIAKAQYGQTKPGLNFEQVRRFQIPVPSLPLQRDFARRVAAVKKLKTTHQASLVELDGLFAVLQFRAFRGEL